MNKRTFLKSSVMLTLGSVSAFPIMRLVFLVIFFCFGTVTFSIAQVDCSLNDCGLLEKVMNDTAVKKFLYSREHFLGFRNASRYFQNCKSLKINGKEYTVSDSVEANSLDYIAVDIIIPETKAFNFFILEWTPMEQAAAFVVKKKKNKYIVTLDRIDNTD